MILTGTEIRKQIDKGRITIDPLSNIGVNSVDLHLQDTLKYYPEVLLDPQKPNRWDTISIPKKGVELRAQKLFLGATIETTWTDSFVPMIEGVSSLARLGIFIHVTGGFGDIGFKGTWTLEIMSIHPVRLYSGMRICQLYFHRPFGEIQQYSGRYQGQNLPQPSQAHEQATYPKDISRPGT